MCGLFVTLVSVNFLTFLTRNTKCQTTIKLLSWTMAVDTAKLDFQDMMLPNLHFPQ